jgi:hypothetical protein
LVRPTHTLVPTTELPQHVKNPTGTW